MNSSCFHQFVSPICFRKFFSVWAVEKPNTFIIGPKQVFSQFSSWKRNLSKISSKTICNFGIWNQWNYLMNWSDVIWCIRDFYWVGFWIILTEFTNWRAPNNCIILAFFVWSALYFFYELNKKVLAPIWTKNKLTLINLK